MGEYYRVAQNARWSDFSTFSNHFYSSLFCVFFISFATCKLGRLQKNIYTWDHTMKTTECYTFDLVHNEPPYLFLILKKYFSNVIKVLHKACRSQHVEATAAARSEMLLLLWETWAPYRDIGFKLFLMLDISARELISSRWMWLQIYAVKNLKSFSKYLQKNPVFLPVIWAIILFPKVSFFSNNSEKITKRLFFGEATFKTFQKILINVTCYLKSLQMTY